MAPVFATSLLYLAEPKSGFQSGSDNLADSPSYSPLLQFARFFLFSSLAAFS